VPISPKISGKVKKVHVAQDQLVKAGGLLVDIDKRNHELAVQKAEAELQIVAVLILPMMGQLHDIISEGFALYFVLSGMLAILLQQLAHGLFPDPPGGQRLPPDGSAKPGYVRDAALAAPKSTVDVSCSFLWPPSTSLPA